MANALAAESSPYLRQHRDNPVDWLPWGEDALRRARQEDKPLLVSIGYSACHWCHVMERESFEDPATAAVMNEHFVCVKVDREERPDVDAIYMEAVQAMTGHGGWPLNVFVTPDQVPFYGGTYFPPAPRHGMPDWVSVLQAVAEAWRERREEVVAQGARMAERLAATAGLAASPNPFAAASFDIAVHALRSGFDREHGGWGGTPKFPAADVCAWLLRRGERDMALATLDAMAAGGMHDQVGGGFARYAVDRTWTVPHFEKMLYDNALLARAYLDAWLATGDERHARVVQGTLDWALREMRAPEGGFFSALDADSEGVEGKFYVWTVAELRDVLGDDADAAIAWLGATPQGNFTDPHHPAPGLNVLEARGPEPPAAVRERVRARLLEARCARVRPGLDDKRLAAWNALMVGALARAGAHLPEPAYVAAAGDAAAFVLDTMRDERGRLLRTSDGTTAKLNGYLEDHAFLLAALLDLYEATFAPRWFVAAVELAGQLRDRFADPAGGGFFSTASDHEQLLVRRKDLEDAPLPSGGAAAALGLLRLAAFTGDAQWEELAVAQLRITHEIAVRHPTAFAHTLMALDFHLAPVREVALAGDDVSALAAVVRSGLRPHLVLAGPPGDGVPLMDGRVPVEGRAAAYVCEGFACRMPETDPGALRAALATG